LPLLLSLTIAQLDAIARPRVKLVSVGAEIDSYGEVLVRDRVWCPATLRANHEVIGLSKILLGTVEAKGALLERAGVPAELLVPTCGCGEEVDAGGAADRLVGFLAAFRR